MIAVAGASAISGFGAGWRGLGRALVDRVVLPGVPADPSFELSDPIARARKMMSRSAYLAAWCLRGVMRDTGWSGDGVGYFLGVGASGGSMDDLTAILAASLDADGLSLTRLGGDGLAACNPLLAFQLMNNFTMCHGAIIEGTSGPSSALFSRGAGTTAALVEAVAAIESGECARAIAGGADSALHPVTRAELARDGFVARGLVPAEGAALVALQAGAGSVVIDGCAIAAASVGSSAIEDRAIAASSELGSSAIEGRASAVSGVASAASAALGGASSSVSRGIDDAFERARVVAAGARWLVIAPWGPPASDAIRAWAADRAPAATIVDLSILGDALAASQALAWIAAIDLVDGTGDRAVAVGAGTDGDVGVAAFRGAS